MTEVAACIWKSGNNHSNNQYVKYGVGQDQANSSQSILSRDESDITIYPMFLP